MKEVPQKTAYVVIDPAWGEPEIILGLNMEAEHA